MKRTIHAVDLFCGAGGASVGLRRACEALGLDFTLLAINHWDTAIKTHMSVGLDTFAGVYCRSCRHIHAMPIPAYVKTPRMCAKCGARWPECGHD